jgi:precorrin-6B C5,15-methyltransferase / cobalt-precorrin-6B C5,C15-methyltransferase
MTAAGHVTVVGIGADGWPGLGDGARAAILAAGRVIGSRRQLALLPADHPPTREWPSPLAPLVDELVDDPGGDVCVLASGDPMLHGIGATLARRLEPERLTVIPHPSALSIACARLHWPSAEVELVNTLSRPVEAVLALAQPGRRVIVYVTGADGAARVAEALTAAGYGASRLIALARLGAADERITEATAASWGDRAADPLHTVAVDCVPDLGTPLHPRTPGLPDDAYDHDGQLTKRHVRAVTVAALGPAPRARLWDVGAGSGSISIEWLRAEPTAGAIAIERDETRARRAGRNALALGVPQLRVVHGSAPAVLRELDQPNAVFIGGGLSAPELIDSCWDRLVPGGRLVANAVTLEGERSLFDARARHGGTLTRVEIAHAEPIGSFTGWTAQRPVVQWRAERPR